MLQGVAGTQSFCGAFGILGVEILSPLRLPCDNAQWWQKTGALLITVLG